MTEPPNIWSTWTVSGGRRPTIWPTRSTGSTTRTPLDQRRELLLHRCFVRTALPRDEDDRYPSDDRISLTTAQWPLAPESIVRVPSTR
ncbi:MAG: hypothetical protein ACRDNL_14210 [Spirillospora sp.]